MISWPVSSFTRYRVSGRISVTRPSNSISSSFAMLSHSDRLAMWDGIAARFDTTVQKGDATEIAHHRWRWRGSAAPRGRHAGPRRAGVTPALQRGLGGRVLGGRVLGGRAIGRGAGETPALHFRR